MGSITIDTVREVYASIASNLKKVIVGLNAELKYILISLLANGHVLLEGVPGVAKTTIVRALVKLLNLNWREMRNLNNIPYTGWSRVQFTPDLMPSDIIGTLVFNPIIKDFEPRFGPVFTYILLADEINRAIPRTQSALLQAMQEREVTIGSTIYKLEDRDNGKFFFVLATQNPIEQEGTYPLPEAQLDRFLMRVLIPYPKTLEDEKTILRLHMGRLREPIEDLEPVIYNPSMIIQLQDWIAENILVDETTLEYVTRILRNSRPEVNSDIGEYVVHGASPRAGIHLLRAAKVNAALRGSNVAEPVDVDEVIFPVLNHRLILNPEKLVEVRVEAKTYVATHRVAKEAIESIVGASK
ncbi:MAG: ATPase [Thermoprotei archaeon]|nr:MAG: ATPase [Thermoprotei archaeon]